MRGSALSHRISVVVAMAAVVLLLLTILAPQEASAHVRVTRGKYLFVIGWTDEPALVGLKNSLDLSIFNTSTGLGVKNAEGNLTAKFLYGTKALPVDLVPVFNKTGFYAADIIPTAAGTYRVNLTGRVGNQPVSFATPLDDVGWPTALEFPNPRPTVENLSSQANGAQTMATYGVAVGASGLILGAAALGVALISRRRHREG